MLLKLLGCSKPIPLHDHTDSRQSLRSIEHQRSGDPMGDPTFVRHVDHVTDADERARKAERILRTRRAWAGAAAAFLLSLAVSSFAEAAQVIVTKTSPDGQWKVEIADWASPSKFELWSTPAVGGVRRKIGGVVPHDYDVFEFQVSADSSRVAYRQGRTATGESKLYSTPIDAARGAQISQPLPALGRVDAGLAPWWGGSHVRYRWSAEPGQLGSIFVAPMAGGRILGVVFVDGFEGGSAGAWR